jgi:hypothetical protein
MTQPELAGTRTSSGGLDGSNSPPANREHPESLAATTVDVKHGESIVTPSEPSQPNWRNTRVWASAATRMNSVRVDVFKASVQPLFSIPLAVLLLLGAPLLLFYPRSTALVVVGALFAGIRVRGRVGDATEVSAASATEAVGDRVGVTQADATVEQPRQTVDPQPQTSLGINHRQAQ